MSGGSDVPFEAMIEALRAQLVKRRDEALAGVEPIRAALDAYVEAIDAQVLHEFGERNGLAGADPESMLAPRDAAGRLLEAVRALPPLLDAGSAPAIVGPTSTPDAAPAASIPSIEPAVAPRAVDEPVVPAGVPQLDRSSAPPSTRRRPTEPLDDDGVAFREEFEAIDFDDLKDPDFLSYANEFAARARLRQEQGLSTPSDLEGRIIRRLTALAATRSLPRPVFGLSRSHKGDWAAIARRVRDEREGRASAPDRPSGLTHRISIPAQVEVAAATDDDAVPAEDEQRESDAPLALPNLRAAAADAEVVMVGGMVKREKLDRVRARTGIPVEWIGLAAGKSAAAVASLAKRIREGRIAALVVLNGLMQHKEYEPLIAAAREHGLPVAYADKAGKGALVKAFVELEERLGKATG
jgi:hypothetical protein